MPINKIAIRNFKSFKSAEVELGSLNVLLGANASGKSNFIRVLRFIKDVANHGLSDAIYLQGGAEYFRNLKTRHGSSSVISIDSDQELSFPAYPICDSDRKVNVEVAKTSYEFALRLGKTGSSCEVLRETLSLECKFVERSGDDSEKSSPIAEGRIRFTNRNGSRSVELSISKGKRLTRQDVLTGPTIDQVLPSQTLLLEAEPRVDAELHPFRSLPTLITKVCFADLSIIDIDPRVCKERVLITGKGELEEDGRNLAVALRKILDQKEKRRKFLNIVRDVLPFIDDFGLLNYADKTILMKLKEKYKKDVFLPASFISDGTINIIALVIALYFEERGLVVIEEPERNVHPYLISKIVGLLKEASGEKQIIVTTHNPEVVRHADLGDLLLVSRSRSGFSRITRPAQSREVKAFLNENIGIGELHIQDLLGG